MHAYRISCLSLILTLICHLHPAFSFEYASERWQLKDLPIPCYLNVSSIPVGLPVGDVERAIIQSIEAWNRATEIQLFKYSGHIEVKTPIADDGWNAISLVSTDWLEMTKGLPVNRFTQGITSTWGINDPIGSPPDSFAKDDFLRAFDIALMGRRIDGRLAQNRISMMCNRLSPMNLGMFSR